MIADKTFDNLVRGMLRDFIRSRSWSVSRFASRYVEAYADKYSKMEAPGTSTARKLIEDETHVFTERETEIIDSFTKHNFHELWLEEQKRILLDKTERYIIGQNDPQISANFDSLTILEGRIAALEKKDDQLTLDDVASVARRYVDIETDKPLVIWSDSIHLGDIVYDNLLGTDIRSVTVDTRFHDPIKAIDKIKSNGKALIKVVSDNRKLAAKLHRKYGKDIVLFLVNINQRIEDTMKATPYADRLGPLNRFTLRYCLEKLTDFPEMFKQEMISCLESPWVHFPKLNDARDCMRFLTRLYESQKDILSADSPLFPQFKRVVMAEIPDNWLLKGCDTKSLLMVMSLFDDWVKEHPDYNTETVKNVMDNDLGYLMTFGRVPKLSADIWKQWLTEKYYEHLVHCENYSLTDIQIAVERRKLPMMQR